MKAKPPGCAGCPLETLGEGFAPGEGPTDAKLAIYGEALGAEEAAEGRPFVGGAGRILNALLVQAGISRKEVFIDNVLRCRPPGNKYPTGKQRTLAERHCRQYDCVGRSIFPRVVVLAGDKALRVFAGLTGISHWRGSIILERRRRETAERTTKG